MGATPWIILAVIVILLLIAIVLMAVRGRKQRPTDYFALYLVGLVWFLLGIVSGNLTLGVMGLIFAVLGMVNRDKWKKNREILKKVYKRDGVRALIFGLVVGVILALVLGFFIFGNILSEESYCGGMALSEAMKIAEDSECAQGTLLEVAQCNENGGNNGAWWIDFEPFEKKEGCNPACVVDVESRKAEINWRCTGLILP